MEIANRKGAGCGYRCWTGIESIEPNQEAGRQRGLPVGAGVHVRGTRRHHLMRAGRKRAREGKAMWLGQVEIDGEDWTGRKISEVIDRCLSGCRAPAGEMRRVEDAADQRRNSGRGAGASSR